jgi:hypothetical protein
MIIIAFGSSRIASLCGRANLVRRAAHSLPELGRMADPPNTQVERCARNLDGELEAFHAWYTSLGSALVERRGVPPPHVRDAEGGRRLLACVRNAARDRDKATVNAALVLLWSSQHLDNLRRLEAHLAQRANAARAASTAAD